MSGGITLYLGMRWNDDLLLWEMMVTPYTHEIDVRERIAECNRAGNFGVRLFKAEEIELP